MPPPVHQLPPADMEISLAEADAARARSAAPPPAHPPAGGHGPPSLADIHRNHGGAAPGAHHGEGEEEEGLLERGLHWLHSGHTVADIAATGAEALHIHHLMEAAPQARTLMQQAGVVAEHTQEAARAGQVGASTIAGRILGPIGIGLGANQMREGVEHDNALDVLEGGVGMSGGLATSIAAWGPALGAAGAGAAAAPVAAVLGAAGAGMAFGHHVVDPAMGGAMGAVNRAVLTPEQERAAAHDAPRLAALCSGREEVAARGLHRNAAGNIDRAASSHMVDRHENLSERLAAAAAGGTNTGAVSDAELDRQSAAGRPARDIATYLPTMLGGDVPTANVGELHRRWQGLQSRTIDGIWNSATGLFH